MANADNAFGLRPKRYVSGAPYNGACNRYYIPSSDSNGNVYVGQLVKHAGGADSRGVPSVRGDVSTSNVVVGVVVAVEAVTQDSTIYRADDTERYVYVADDPNLLFEVQDDASATLAATDVGSTADLTGFTSGSTASGLSSIEISATTATTGAGDEDVMIVSLSDTEDNEIGDNAVWLVRLLNHLYSGDQSGV